MHKQYKDRDGRYLGNALRFTSWFIWDEKAGTWGPLRRHNFAINVRSVRNQPPKSEPPVIIGTEIISLNGSDNIELNDAFLNITGDKDVFTFLVLSLCQ